MGGRGEGILAGVVHERDPGRAAGGEITLDQIVCGVVVAGNMDFRRADRIVSGAERRHDCLSFLRSTQAVSRTSLRHSEIQPATHATAISSGMVPALSSCSIIAPMRLRAG